MEIFELLITLGAGALESAEACACVVQLIAGIVDVTGVWVGVSAAKETKKRRELKEEGVPAEGRNRPLIFFVVLLPFALLATALAIYSLVRIGR